MLWDTYLCYDNGGLFIVGKCKTFKWHWIVLLPLLFDKQPASILGPWTEVQEQSFIIILYRQRIYDLFYMDNNERGVTKSGDMERSKVSGTTISSFPSSFSSLLMAVGTLETFLLDPLPEEDSGSISTLLEDGWSEPEWKLGQIQRWKQVLWEPRWGRTTPSSLLTITLSWSDGGCQINLNKYVAFLEMADQ